MIKVDETIDRGRALYDVAPTAVCNYIKGRRDEWFGSPQYRRLKNNCRIMDAYVDGAGTATTTGISDIVPQLIRRGYNEYKALFGKFLETDPLFSVRRNNKMSEDQEREISGIINDNLEKTYYRETCLQWTIDDAVRYGTAVTYTFASSDFNASSLLTVKDDNYEGNYKQVYTPKESAIISVPVHPLNAIVDPRASFMVQPTYKGFLADISLTDVTGLLQNQNYIKKNVQNALNIAKVGQSDEYWFDGAGSEKKNYSKGHCTICYLWTPLHFEGNEDDSNIYCIEMIGDKIIRIEENVLDHGIIPVAIQRVMPRKYEWYGNSMLQDKIAIQNLQYYLFNTLVESSARANDRVILIEEGKIDITALNSRHSTGGFVPVKNTGVPLEKLMYSPPMPMNGFQTQDYLVQLSRREDMDSSSMPNFNPMSEGGTSNKTLGGAQMMASIGEMKTGEMIASLCSGLKDVARHQLVLLRNVSDDYTKSKIIGDVNFSVKVSNTFNYAREGIDAMNRLTQTINLKATKLPEFDYIKTGTMVKEWLRNSCKRENIDEFIDIDGLGKYEKEAKQKRDNPPPPIMPQMPQMSQMQQQGLPAIQQAPPLLSPPPVSAPTNGAGSIKRGDVQ